MVMLFDWVDLWLAVTIILPFTPAGCRNQAAQLEPEGEREREREKANIRATGNTQVGRNEEKYSHAVRMKTTWPEKDRRE